MLNCFTKRKYIFKIPFMVLLVLSAACKSPLAEVRTLNPVALDLKITEKDHSRNLKRLKSLQPGESNSATARANALESHRKWLETEFRAEAKDRGLILEPGARLRLELALTSLGEVRAKYIVYGIASGVAWGLGTGLVAHDPRLAIGLGLYELIEESAFWIAGSALFGAYSAPAVVEVSVFEDAGKQAIWKETYYVLNGRKRLHELPKDQRQDRAIQLHGTLRVFLDKLFKDLEALPGFPHRAGPPRTFTQSAPLASALP